MCCGQPWTGRAFEITIRIAHSASQNIRLLPHENHDFGVLDDVYTYDMDGDITAITDNQNGGQNTRNNMSYDGLNRLTSVTAPNKWGTANYHYDSLDNPTSNSIATRTTTYSYGVYTNSLSGVSMHNQLTGVDVSGTQNIFYDGQGNITTGPGRAFTFDQGNRLTSANGVDTYKYDGLGRRTSAAASGTTTLYFYSLAGQLLYSRAQTGSTVTTTDYIYPGWPRDS